MAKGAKQRHKVTSPCCDTNKLEESVVESSLQAGNSSDQPTVTQATTEATLSSSDLNSDNSQSSTSVPPDITQTEGPFSADDLQIYSSDPPDLNPENPDLPADLTKPHPFFSPTYETAELSDSSGPPDITNSNDYDKIQEEEEDPSLELKSSDYPEVYVESESPAPFLTSLEEQGELTADFPTDIPEDPHCIFADSENPPDLLQQEELSPPEGYLGSSFSETNFSESLQAVAPGDILPVVSLPQNPTSQQLYQQNSSLQGLNTKRGPGRPRKDGLDPLPRKKPSKSVAKSIVTKAQRILHNISGFPRKPAFVMMDSTDTNSQGSLGDIVNPVGSMGGSMETSRDSTSQYEMLDEDVSTTMSSHSDETSYDSQLPVRICSLCNCGERSLLGQGDLCRYEPTPGFNPLKKAPVKGKKTEFDERCDDKGTKHLTWRRHRGPMKGTREREKSKSPRRYPHSGDDDPNAFLGDELNIVGYLEDTDVTQVFEPTGHTWAHHCCAAWSEGVVQSQDNNLKYVDKAVLNGLSQKCSYCRRYGATIICVTENCAKKYHYPCAAAGACFQDIKTLSLLCPDHTDQAEVIAGDEALCILCGKCDKISKQLFCTSCGHHYHGSCLHPSVAMSPEVRAGWQCPDCKVCQMCRQPGEDSKMLVCDTCDKGYHTFCLKPVMTTIPKNGWKCKNCRVCGDCGSRTPGSGPSSRWHLNYSVCDSCYQQRNKGLSCPLCGKAYRQFTQKAMIQCTTCKKHVHAECDDAIDAVMLQHVKNEEETDYICSVCRNRDPEMDISFPFSLPPHSEDTGDDIYGMKTDSDIDNGSSIMDDNSSQLHDSFLFNDDSISSTDIDISALEKGVQQLSSPTHSHPHPEGYGIGSKGGKLNANSRKKMGSGKSRSRSLAPEKKKRTPSFCERKRGPKPKLKTSHSGSSSQMSPALPGESKKATNTDDDDDGDDHPQTLILANALDKYVLEQDVCKSCGSFGRGEEGKLIVCTQCGQCYHPYCAGIKVTKVVLQKGWRCLDCTVCEGCGKPYDEGRLILCDECDISYHIYCLDPPLDHVPKGTWKCKWCVMCINCGTTTPGFGCQWQNNYTQCGPCRSKLDCPVCKQNYREEEMIIQCVQCDRWLHAVCDGLHSEDDMERAADYGYHCLFCRPKTGKDGPLPPLPPTPPPVEVEEKPPTPPPPPLIKEPEPLPQKRYLVDGIYLSETGIHHIQEITMQVPKQKRPRRWGKKPSAEKLALEMQQQQQMQLQQQQQQQMQGKLLQTQLSVDGEEGGPQDMEDIRTSVDGDILMPTADGEQRMESDGLLSPTGAPSGLPLPGDPEKKERKRRTTVSLGVGGFIAKHRQQRGVAAKRQASVPGEGAVEVPKGQPRPEGEEAEPVPTEGEIKKRKPRQARKKSQLEHSFPSYLQEAFFGKEILDKSKAKVKLGQKADSDTDEGSRASTPHLPKDIPQPTLFPNMDQSAGKLPSSLPPVSTTHAPAPGPSTSTQAQGEDDMQNIDEMFPNLEEHDILNILNKELDKDRDLPMEEPIPSHPQEGPSVTCNTELPGNLGGIFSPNLSDVEPNIDVDMFAEGLTQIDSKTVEDIFKGVLHPEPGSSTQAPEGSTYNFPLSGAIPGQMGGPRPPPPQHEEPVPGQGLPPRYPYPPNFGPRPTSPSYNNSQPSWQQVAQDEEQKETTSRRNMLKWECDEDLGENATISAVLYCNLKHPELKQQYPDWSERVKKIAKAWRELSGEEKQPYLAQARKNRANTKVQRKSKAAVEMRKQKQREAAAQKAMGPPPPPVPPGQLNIPPGTPYPPQPGAEGMGSPMTPGQGIHSPLNRSNSQIIGTPEGHSPGQLPGSLPASPLSGHQGPPPDHHRILPPTPPEHFHQGMGPVSMGPPVTHQQDPYAQGPPTPRPHIFKSPHGAADPYGQVGMPGSTDPYAKPPSTPLPGPQTPLQSPSKPQWPGVGPEVDPYEHPPPTPRSMPGKQIDGMPSPRPQIPTSAPSYDPYAQPPHTPRPSMGPHGHPQGIPRPSFTRQASQPGEGYPMPPQAARPDDPYAFPPTTPRPVSQPQSPVGRPDMSPHQGKPPPEAYPPGMMPGQPVDHTRPPFMPRSSVGSIGQPQIPPGDPQDSFGVPGQTHMRHPFRPMVPPTSQPMARPHGGQEVYMKQPGMPHHGMEPPREQSALQQMFAAANRRHALFPIPGIFSTLKHPYLAMQDKISPNDPKQVREILAKQTKSRQMKKAKKETEAVPPPWEGTPPGMSPTQGIPGPYPGDERFPGPGHMGMERWPGPMARPPGPRQFRPEMEHFANMRGPYGEMIRPGVPGQMRQPRPPVPMPSDIYPPTRPGQASPQMATGIKPGPMMEHRLPHPVPQNSQQQQPGMPYQPPPQAPYVQYAQAGPPQHGMEQPRMPFEQAPTPHQAPGLDNLGKLGDDQDVPLPEGDDRSAGGMKQDANKEVKLPEDDKQEVEEDINDLLDNDGTFDIIKFVDTDTVLNLTENKSIFDDLDEVENEVKGHHEDEAEASKDKDGTKPDLKLRPGDKESDAAKSAANITDFQAKFLEFSQKHSEDGAVKLDPGVELSESEKKKQEQQNISHIAALLQSTDHMSRTLERRDSQKSEGSMSGKDQHPRTPGSGPVTPSGLPPGMEGGPLASVGPRAPYGPGIHSPMHQMQGHPAQPSPGSVGQYPNQGPGTPGLPSPKIMPSPKSNIPSPRTPNVQSPFNTAMASGPQGQQMSPFPQTHSPFSPSVSATSSAPQSPYATSKTQSPFTLPSGSSNQPSYGVPTSMPDATTVSAAQSPGQRSPRGTITPTNQYMQGTFNQPMIQGPRGTTLTPTPNSILYGQSVTSQHGIRNQGPPVMTGPRPQFPGAPGQQMPQGMEAVASQMPEGAPGQPMQGPQPPQPGMEAAVRFPGQQMPPVSHIQGQIPGAAMAQYGAQMQRMPGMRPQMPGVSSSATTAATSQPSSRPQLLQEQPLLIQDLLEQEKQEQQRQAQQQAMLHRQNSEGMMGNPPRPGMPPMGNFRPRMEAIRNPGDPNWVGQRPYGQPELPPGQPPFRMRMPGQQMPPRMQVPFGAQGPGGHVPMGMPPPQPMPPPPMTGELTPELERQHHQYEDWLMKHAQYLEMHAKNLEQQLQKCKRTKKAINARNRQAKKTGKEASPNDAIELERTVQEISVKQKELDGIRKQVKQHQVLTTDHRTKKQERYGQDWMFSQIPAPSGPQGMEMRPGQLQPRIPGQQGSARLTASDRQAYDEYMQNRLRQTQQQGAPGVGPRPQHTVVEESAAKAKQAAPKAILQDNNPFSEEYQEREQREREIFQPPKPGTDPAVPLDKPEMMRQMPPQFYAERTMPYDQGGRFPGPRIPAEHIPRFQAPPGQRFQFDGGNRMPGPTEMPQRPPFPPNQGMYTQMTPNPMEQTRPPGPRAGVPPFQPGYGLPPTTPEMGQGTVEGEKQKPKKRKKKKKPAETATGPGANTGPVEPRPPIQYTPQSETEKRIMEILNSTVGQARAQQDKDAPGGPEKTTGKVSRSDSGSSVGASSDSSKPAEGKKPDDEQQQQSPRVSQQQNKNPSSQVPTPEASTQLSTDQQNLGGNSGELLQNIQHHQALSRPGDLQQQIAEANKESEVYQQEEPILPMNVMIQQPPHRPVATEMPPASVAQGVQAPPHDIAGEIPTQTMAQLPGHFLPSGAPDQATGMPGQPPNKLPQQHPTQSHGVPPHVSSQVTMSQSNALHLGQGQLPPMTHPSHRPPPPPHLPPGAQLPGRMSPRGMVPPQRPGLQHTGHLQGRMSPRQAAPFGGIGPPPTSVSMPHPSQHPGRASPRQASPSPGRYSPRQPSNAGVPQSSQSPGRYSPRQGSPGGSKPPSRPPSQPGQGYMSPRQGIGHSPSAQERQSPRPGSLPSHSPQGRSSPRVTTPSPSPPTQLGHMTHHPSSPRGSHGMPLQQNFIPLSKIHSHMRPTHPGHIISTSASASPTISHVPVSHAPHGGPPVSYAGGPGGGMVPGPPGMQHHGQRFSVPQSPSFQDTHPQMQMPPQLRHPPPHLQHAGGTEPSQAMPPASNPVSIVSTSIGVQSSQQAPPTVPSSASFSVSNSPVSESGPRDVVVPTQQQQQASDPTMPEQNPATS